MILVGVGHLGMAILSYDGFQPQGFIIVDAFDADSAMIGQKVAGLTIRDVAELPRYLKLRPVDVGIVATPAASAASIIDTLIAGGVHSILNYAPVAMHVPDNVQVKNIDPVLALQSMTFYLKSAPSAK
jgi:redox-sensing transcriptional repressor